MTKGNRTTLEQRIEIAEDCLAHGRNYKETAEKYQVSYQQVRNYTLKYEEKGIEGLRDRRGRRKPEEEMNEMEKLRAENRMLRAEKRYLETENRLLKKLEELERRRG